MLFRIINELVETTFGLIGIALRKPSHSLVENHIWRLIVVVHRTRRLLQPLGRYHKAFLRLSHFIKAFMRQSEVVINIVFLRSR
ncbi:hypothetical protein D3C85_1402990 [compost metagenome]